MYVVFIILHSSILIKLNISKIKYYLHQQKSVQIINLPQITYTIHTSINITY
jgi:hypothetical protein